MYSADSYDRLDVPWTLQYKTQTWKRSVSSADILSAPRQVYDGI
jgi:hypothetical protein